MRVPRVDNLEATNLHYRVQNPQQFAGERIAIMGGGDSALDWVIELAGIAEFITLGHRRDEYRAVPASVEKMRKLVADGKMDVVENAKVAAVDMSEGAIASISLKTKDGDAVDVPVDDVLVFFGLAPKLGPIAEWGLDINRKTINVDVEKFETSVPGIYAVGDINFYPGKKKLILCGFHEAAMAAFAIKQQIEPDKKVRVQYTTTSPLMHERLGVED